MATNAIGTNLNSVNKILTNINANSTNETENTNSTSFADYLKGALDNVNSLQQEANTATEKLASGEIQDIHSVMIAVEKSELALQFTLAIRNKVMDAYSEIMRMQV